MGGSNNTTRSIPMMIVILVLIILLSDAGTKADSSDASPPSMARRPAGPPPPPESTSSTFAATCPWFKERALIDACRSPPGLRACVAMCLIFHYRGGSCDVLPNGRPGDCSCTNCLMSSDAAYRLRRPGSSATPAPRQ